MPRRGDDCPFLNRTDPRCGEHLSLDKLQHAFEYCLHRYQSCSVYAQLLFEEQLCGTAAAAEQGSADAPEPLVQLTIAPGLRRQHAAAGRVSAAPGL